MDYEKLYQMVADKNLSIEEALAMMEAPDAVATRTQSEEFPLSEGQKALWVIYQLSHENYAYNTPVAFLISPLVDKEILKRAFQEIMENQPALRTIFKTLNGQPVQQVNEAMALDFAEESIEGLGEEDIKKVLLAEARRPFELEQGPLFRVRLYRRSEGNHILLLNFHHIVFDGISSQIFVEELEAAYMSILKGNSLHDGRKKASYKDFVNWQKAMLESVEGEAHRKFWLDKMGNGSGELDLPFDNPRPSMPSYSGKSYSVELSKETVEALRLLSLKCNVTLFTVMLSSFKVLLHRYTNSNEIAVGTPMAGRPDMDFERTIGYFMNMVVINSFLSAETCFDELLESVQRNVFETFEHSDYPYFTLIRELRKKNKNISDLFNVAFYFQNWLEVPEDAQKDRLVVDSYHGLRQEGEFDLTLEVIEEKEGCALYFKYNPDLFQEDTIVRISSHYMNILERVSCNAGVRVTDIELFTAKEKEMMVSGWNDTRRGYDFEKSVFDMFADQARKQPEALAVACDEWSLSYGELYRKSIQLASYLNSKGIGRGDLVGIYMERSVDLLTGLLGILGSGAGYVPLDPVYPADRIQMMLEDSKVACVVTESGLAGRIPVEVSNLIRYDELKDIGSAEEKLAVKTLPEDTAYVIFTSGSTGRPKGVEVLHRGLTNFLCSMAEEPGFGSQDRLLAVTTVCFDISYLELFLPIITGGTVEIVPSSITRDGIKLREKVENGGFTVMQATPATWQMLLKAGWDQKLPIKILCGGEALPVELADRLVELSEGVWNLYGPTETTIWSSCCQVRKGQKVTIGFPIANTQLYVLDNSLQLCPVGVTGELYIGGDGLAKGYFNRPDETLEKFVESPFDSSSRLYRTGDMARYLFDGTVEYLGRADNQVKIRGFRVELGEIETALKGIEGIHDAVVVIRKDGEDRKRLAAFLIAGERFKEVSVSSMQELLKSNLPDYMIPSQYIKMTSFPMTLNAKIDRKTLATSKIADLQGKSLNEAVPAQTVKLRQDESKPANSMAVSSRRNYMEELLKTDITAMIQKILQLDAADIKRDINIGELGFDSISFTSLGVEINNTYSIKINATLFYEYSTIESLASYLTENYTASFEKYYSSALQDLKETVTDEKTGKAKKSMAESSKSQNVNEGVDGRIAVIGIAGMLPGSKDLDEFWDKLLAKEDLVSVIPEDRWDYKLFYGDAKKEKNKCLSKWGGFMSEIHHFDALFFGLSPREAEIMDPQQRLFLQVAWQAMEDAGYKPSSLSGSDTGVFVGCTGTDFLDVLRSSGFDIDAHSISGISRTIIPNRLSYLMNFHGPSAVIDTACSSSLVAVHRAVASLQRGECSMAIAGGVNLILSPYAHVALGKTDMLSVDGRCKAFDKSANGYVRGEGICAILLKPLSKAIECGDNIYAVICGTSENHGGRTNSLTAPNVNAQTELLVDAYSKAGIDPSTVTYIEAHGTGTALGDPIEINALKKAFSQLYKNRGLKLDGTQYCGVGSVKTNIGHLEAAAGIAGLLKALLAIKNHTIPGNLHLKELNQYIEIENSPFYINSETHPWEHLVDKDGNEIPYRSGVSSFGFGGVNAHVVIEEYQKQMEEEPTLKERLIVLSAKTSEALNDYAQKLLDYMKNKYDEKTVRLCDLAYTLQAGREEFEERLAVVVNSGSDLKTKLEAYCSGTENVAGLYRGCITREKSDISMLLEGDEGADYLKNIIETKKLQKLAKLWVKGLKVDWEDLYEENPLRISLPTYPFIKTIYKIEADFTKAIELREVYHPLIDGIHPTAGNEMLLCFKKVFSGNEKILKDHEVNGTEILPGVGYLEMVREAVSRFRKGDFAFSKVTWLNPLAVDQGEKEVYILLKDIKSAGIEYEVRSQSVSGTLHSKGQIRFLPAGHASKEEHLSVEGLKGKCSNVLDGQTFYKVVREAGINYKRYFQGVDTIWFGKDEAISLLRLPEKTANELSNYTLHPTLMDGALQTMAVLMEAGETPKIPFAVDQLEILRPLTGEGYAYVRRNSPSSFHIALCDSKGNVCVKFINLVSREVRDFSESMYYYPQWEKATPDSIDALEQEEYNSTVLLITPKAGTCLEDSFRRKFSKVYEIKLGTETARLDESTYSIDTFDKGALEKCISEIPGFDRIYFLGGIGIPNSGVDILEQVNHAKEHGILTLYRLCKAFGNGEYKKQALELVIVTNNSVRITGDEAVNPLTSATIGFSMAVSQEYPKWKVKHLDISFETDSPDIIVSSLAALSSKDFNDTGILALRGGSFYRRSIRKLGLPKAQTGMFKQNGVYFIVGGAGGIGLSLSMYLARNYNARLVLTGRRALDSKIEKELDEIRKAGGKALYIQVDAADLSALQVAANKVSADFGNINGVIHSALVLNDKTVENMSEDELREVLHSKVDGSVALYKAFEATALDFMLFFSSTNAFLRSAGQSNYSAGCMFQDLFAMAVADTAPYPVKVINWSYWNEVGIVASEEYSQRLSLLGMRGIKTKEGIEAIERVLNSPADQVIVIKADKKILDRMGCDNLSSVTAYPCASIRFGQMENQYRPSGSEEETLINVINGFKAVEKYGVLLLWRAFRKMGCFLGNKEEYQKEALREKLGISSEYYRLYDVLLAIMEQYGHIKTINDRIISTSKIEDAGNPENIKASIASGYPALMPYVNLLEACLLSYPDILTGSKNHMEVMFPEGSKSLVEPIYKGNALVDYYNKTVALVIRKYVEKRLEKEHDQVVTILEIGAGTGGTSAFVFEALRDLQKNVKYYYTDISVGFTQFGEKQYGADYGFAVFKPLDIEKDLEGQGFTSNSIDISFGSNVIHATTDISRTFRNVKGLLRENGLFILNELTSRQVFSTLTFGLTSGWWLFEDGENRIPGSPLLSTASWSRLLYMNGFRNISIADVMGGGSTERDQSIIMGQSNGLVEVKALKPLQLEVRMDTEIKKVAVAPSNRTVTAAKQPKQARVVKTVGSPSDLRGKTFEYLKEIFAKTLKIDTAIIKGDSPFEKYGVDSMIIIELNKSFEELFGQVPSAILFEHVTLNALTDYFISNYGDKIEKKFGVVGTAKEQSFADTEEYEDKTEYIDGEISFDIADNYLPVIEETRAPVSQDIAIVGIAGRYPKAENVEEFWNNLKEGQNCVSEIPPERWDWKEYFDAQGKKPGTSYSKWGGFIKDVDAFDSDFFEISDGLASEMDPQERIFMEMTWHLLENAGYPFRSLSQKGYRTGVYVGVMYGTYGMLGAQASMQGNMNNAQSSYWLIANRVSHYFDFNGPSLAVDSACSSSLTSIHLACEAIRHGECDAAVAGGINLVLHPRHFLRLSSLKNLSSSDKTRTFGANGDGFVVGEGAGVVLLKPLDKAIKENDRIYGVIKGSFINSTGNAGAFMSPNPAAQGTLIEEAIKRAGIDARTISYIEAHGTGTNLGDPVEISGLSKAFRKYTEDKQFCAIGSVKSNIGHLEAAAGISALTKVVMQMKYKKLAPVLHVEHANPYINFKDSPFYISNELGDWEAPTMSGKVLPRRAGVSSFGAGGANAHLILEEYTGNELERNLNDNGPRLIILSARNEERLIAYAEKLASFLENADDLALTDIAYTLQMARYPMEQRLAFIAASVGEVKQILKDYTEGKITEELLTGRVNPDDYSGEGEGAEAVYNSDLNVLARRWIAGDNIDWGKLYDNSTPLIVTLVEYPFNKKRHWLPSLKMEGEVVQQAKQIGSYQYTYSHNEPYLRDHVTFGEQVLLGVTHLSLAAQSISQAYKGTQGLYVRNFLLVEPIIVKQGEIVDITIDLHQENEKLVFVSRFRNNSSEAYRDAARGEFYFSKDFAAEPFDFRGFINECEKKYVTDDIYTRKKPGVYGSSLMTVRETYVKSGEVVAKLELTNEIMKDGHTYQIHPALLDGAMVARFALLEDSNEPEPFIPLMIKKVSFLGSMPNSCYCHVRQVKSNDEMWEIDLNLYSMSGEHLASLSGFVGKRVRMGKAVTQMNNVATSENAHSVLAISKDDDLKVKIKKHITYKLVTILNIPEKAIKQDKNFMDMGVTSQNLVELTRDIENEIGVELYPTLFFEYQCMKELVDYFATEYKDKFIRLFDMAEAEMNVNVMTKQTNGSFRLADDIQKQYRDALTEMNIFNEAACVGETIGQAGEKNEPIAIIGLSGIMPQSESLEDFWSKLAASENLVTEIPQDRWDWKAYYKESDDDTSKTRVIWGGFMKDVDKFDNSFFGMSPREVALMDPQQRISLELAWRAIEDAGYNPKDLSGSRTAVFIGVAGHDYSDVLAGGLVESQSQALTGNTHNILTGRISFTLNLHGPSEPVDNACASSLVAIHRAVESLRSGEVELALAGGINVIASPSLYVSFDNVGILSPDGKCKTFDKGADGTVRGEGAGIVVLKPLSKALRDNDNIYAVIRGSAINHGGHSNSITAPNPKQQAEVIIDAFKRAGIDPDTVGLIETHGTGTTLGDPIEINGLKSAFKKIYSSWGKEYRTGNYCALGALKTNIGHLETAAGIAGIIKVLLCIKNGMLPGMINFKELNPYIQLDDSPFYIVNETQRWERVKDDEGKELPYRAGVSSFGFSGVNAHILLEEYMNPQQIGKKEEKVLITLSAQNQDRLKAYAEEIIKFLKKEELSTSSKVNIARNTVNSEEAVRMITSIVADIAGLSVNELEENMSLVECGFETVMLAVLIDRLNKSYDLVLGLTSISMEDSIRDIAGIISSKGCFDSSSNESPKTAGIDLDRIAYTLQKSRSAMDERLVLVVSSTDELGEKLNKYILGDLNIEGMFRGNVRQANASDETERAVELAGNKQLEELGRLWVTGTEFKDWELLYPSGLPQKISLPTYPFARKRHWVIRDEEKEQTKAQMGRASLSALIDSNESTLEEQYYKKTLNKKEFYLRDHIVNGSMILPGVVYLEMARMAGNLAYRSKEVTGLKNIVWAKPIELQEAQCDAFVTLNPGEDITFAIHTGDNAVCSQGTLIYGNLEGSDKERMDIGAVKKRCIGSIDHPEFYGMFHKAGFEYGRSFMPIESIYFNEKEALSLVKAADELLASFDSFLLHPVLLEGGLQTAGYLVNRETRPTDPYIPFALGSLEIFGKLTPRCYAYTTFANDGNDAGVKKMNVALMDESGNVLARITDYMVRPLHKESKDKTVYYRRLWRKAEIQLENQKAQGAVLVFDRDGEVAGQLALSQLVPAILIRPGNSFRCISENEYEINPGDENDYQELFKQLKMKGVECTRIVHLWCLDSVNNFANAGQLGDKLQYGVYSLFYITRAVMAQKFESNIQLMYMYKSEEPIFEGISGFTKSINLENRKMKCKTVGITQKDRQLSAVILNELLCAEVDVEVRYTNSGREVKEMEVQHLIPESAPALKENGVYIITGGMGGIGYIIADSLAGRYKPSLVLTGRTPLNEAMTGKLEALKSKGANPVYIHGDVSEKDQVDNIIREAKAKFGRIDGIIHCAGLIRDSLIANKKLSEMKEVLLPKVHGTINIDMATQNEKLDFIALFSSISGEIGNVGQCDYAYANYFMDCFAKYRNELTAEGKRYGRTLSINWPLWRDGGISVDQATEKFMKNTLHLSPLRNDQGAEIFELCLESGQDQVLVLYGEAEKMGSLFKGTKPTEADAENIAVNADEKEILAKLTEDLVKVVSKISSISVQEISTECELEQYGFDSIIMTEFANELNKKLGLFLTPAIFFELSELNIKNLGELLTNRFKTELTKRYGSLTVEDKTVKNEEKKTAPADNNMVTKSRFIPVINQSTEKESVTVESFTYEPVAIIGIAGVMPQSEDMEEFWKHLSQGESLITEVPAERWNWRDYYGDPLKDVNKTQCKWGGFMKEVDKFDALFFNISPQEARLLDPQQRMFLEAAWKTIENAGYKPSELAGTNTGVFVGVTNTEYTELLSEANIKVEGHSITSNAHFLVANRTSYYFNLKGPSETIDTACSSSGVAIHRAVTSLQTGECGLAIVGGVNILLSPRSNMAFDSAGMLSKEGKCKTFDKDADGFVRGEGIGALLLKPLKKAIADKDPIHAVIRGSAVNHSGRSKSFTSPNPNGQVEVIKAAVGKSGLDPLSISYVEAQGTASTLGDNVEIEGLKKAFGDMIKEYDKSNVDKPSCGIGSVKTNVGHLEAASGIASIFKVILAMKNKEIPASINCRELNPYLNLQESPFYIVRDKMAWNQLTDKNGAAIPRRAGINVFGAGGVNVHLVLEEYERIGTQDDNKVDEPVIMILSAKNKASLMESVAGFARFIRNNPQVNLRDVAYTLQVAREEMDERVAFVASDTSDLLDKCEYFERNKGGAGNTDIIEGNSKVNDEDMIELLSDSGMSETLIKTAVENKQYSRLAKLWVKGLLVNWKELYRNESRLRISLPTYCFNKQRHWIITPKKGIESIGGFKAEDTMISTDTKMSSTDRTGGDSIDLLSLSEKEKVKWYLREKIGLLLGISCDELKYETQLDEIGFDSITAAKFKYEIENELSEIIPIAVFGESRNIASMADKLIENLELSSIVERICLNVQGRQDKKHVVSNISADISKMSEEEMNKLFNSLLYSISDNT